MKILRHILSVMAIGVAYSAMAWSQKGHDVTAYIAEQHLTETTKHAVDSILEGKSLVYWANWLDNASHTPEYRYTSTWHYKNTNDGVSYDDMARHPKGDIELAAIDQVKKLSSGELTPEESALALKILIHLLGDMHQPMHMGRATDLGGNKVKVNYFGRDTNLHSVWDGQVVKSAHDWTYTEWQQQVDRATEAQQQEIIAGGIADWCRETYAVSRDVYKQSPSGVKISFDYVAMFAPVIEQQFLRGGLRLAHVLNQIFDPNY